MELDDREAFEASLIENVQHETLNPIEEAKAFKRYVEEYGYGSVSELARRIGRSHSYVSRRIALLSLSREVQEELVRRRTSVAQELILLKGEERALKLVVEGRVTRRVVRELVKNFREPPYPWYMKNGVEAGERETIRAVDKCVAALKVCYYRIGEVIEGVEDWQIKETLWQHRESLNRQIDSLIRLKKKMERENM